LAGISFTASCHIRNKKEAYSMLHTVHGFSENMDNLKWAGGIFNPKIRQESTFWLFRTYLELILELIDFQELREWPSIIWLFFTHFQVKFLRNLESRTTLKKVVCTIQVIWSFNLRLKNGFQKAFLKALKSLLLIHLSSLFINICNLKWIYKCTEKRVRNLDKT
jgi:hypothetical protein